MLFESLTSLLLVAAGLQAVPAQASTACNNSPSLCSRQYNNITYLGAHDSPFLRNAQTSFSVSGNQFYNTTQQLASGVRLVTGQIQTNGSSTDLHLCHSSCALLDAGPLTSWLSEIKMWMDSNPNDVVTILLVNGADATTSQIASAYESSGMDKYAYTPTSSSATTTWPTLDQLISSGTRAMNFIASLNGDNSGATYLMDEFTYIFENNYENYNTSDFSCTANRPSNLQTSTAISDGYMPLMNHFLYTQGAFGIDTPNVDAISSTNAPSSGGSGNLGDAANTCAATYGKAPTFLLVDFANVGPAIDTADSLNGVSDITGRTALPNQVLTASSSSSSGSSSSSSSGSSSSAGAIALPSGLVLCACLSMGLFAMRLL